MQADRLTTSISGPLPSPWSPLPSSASRSFAALGLGFDNSVKTSPRVSAGISDSHELCRDNLKVAYGPFSPLLGPSSSKKRTTKRLGLGMPTSYSSPPGTGWGEDEEDDSYSTLRGLALEFERAVAAAVVYAPPAGGSCSPEIQRSRWEDDSLGGIGKSFRRPIGRRRLSDIPEIISSVSASTTAKGSVKGRGPKDGLGVAACSPSAATRAVLWASASWSGALG